MNSMEKRFEMAVRICSNHASIEFVRPDIVERMWFEQETIPRSKIGNFICWMEGKGVDSWKIGRMREIHEELKNERD